MQQQFQVLVQKYISGEISPDELLSLKKLLANPQHLSQLELLMDEQLSRNNAEAKHFPDVVSRVKATLLQKLDENPVPPNRSVISLLCIVAAAVLFLVLSGTAIWLFNKEKNKDGKYSRISETLDADPGKNGALLTLASGQIIELDSIVYKVSDQLTDLGTKEFNTITTPNGYQFTVVLQDGSSVWLNAASSIRFPINFTAKKREVEIKGEVFFEVAPDADKPFLVKVNNALQVEVLGTSFNINAYADEPEIQTTLIEGKVNLIAGAEQIKLNPGQQARIIPKLPVQVRDNIKLDKVMAWKNGVFDFQDASLEEVMHQLERWYNIEVVYEGEVPDLEFIGKIGRDLKLSEVLHGLELSGVNFKMEPGKKLIVLP